MMARQKKLNVVEPISATHATADKSFDKPAPKGAAKLVDPENVQELIDLLHNEAKVI